jgi:hypothetical protein
MSGIEICHAFKLFCLRSEPLLAGSSGKPSVLQMIARAGEVKG